MNCIDEGINLLEVLWTYIITMQRMPLFIYTGFESHWTVLNGENTWSIYFGRVKHFFILKFAGETRELAYVNWFKPPFFEEDVNLWRIDTCLRFYKWLPYVFVKDIES